ncbi:MAG: HAD-IA family hydrolase [Betaproteobacteria bacterium]
MMPSLLSFDLDGTLVDTAGEIAHAANQTLADAGLPQRSLDDITLRIGGGALVLMRSLLSDAVAAPKTTVTLRPGKGATRSDNEWLLQRFEYHYAQVAGTLARPYPGCAETLKQLRLAGVRLASVTNKEQVFARQVLRATRLEEFFALLVGGDTLSHKKPHASVLAHVQHVFDCPPDRLAHIGDSRVDVQAARNSGVAAWAVSYGYNAGEPIAAAAPDKLFDSMPEIAQYVATLYRPGPC